MKYFTIQNNKWEIVNIYDYDLTILRQVKLYDFCEITKKMVFAGMGLY